MTKAEFVDRIAGGFESKKAATDAVEAVLDGIASALSRGEDVNFTGFGKFSTQERAARQGRNRDRQGLPTQRLDGDAKCCKNMCFKTPTR